MTWKRFETKIINTVKQDAKSKPFLKPVNEILDDAPGYYSMIQNPMDLNTLSEYIMINRIATLSQFIKQFMLIWNNAIHFNAKDHEIHKLALYFQNKCKQLLIKQWPNYRTIINESILNYDYELNHDEHISALLYPQSNKNLIENQLKEEQYKNAQLQSQITQIEKNFKEEINTRHLAIKESLHSMNILHQKCNSLQTSNELLEHSNKRWYFEAQQYREMYNMLIIEIKHLKHCLKELL